MCYDIIGPVLRGVTLGTVHGESTNHGACRAPAAAVYLTLFKRKYDLVYAILQPPTAPRPAHRHATATVRGSAIPPTCVQTLGCYLHALDFDRSSLFFCNVSRISVELCLNRKGFENKEGSKTLASLGRASRPGWAGARYGHGL